MQEEQFYNYIYCDPRKPGKYCYEGLNFSLLYEPFYVGKGKDRRIYAHLSDSQLKYRSYKNSKIKAIINEQLNPRDFIIKFNNNITDIEACSHETKIISLIGRYDLNLGPLTNKTDGGDGIAGHIKTQETRKKISQIHLGKSRPWTPAWKNNLIAAAHDRRGIQYGGVSQHSEETKSKMRAARQKTYKIIDPDGRVEIFKGSFANFCKLKGWPATTVNKWVNNGIVIPKRNIDGKNLYAGWEFQTL